MKSKRIRLDERALKRPSIHKEHTRKRTVKKKEKIQLNHHRSITISLQIHEPKKTQKTMRDKSDTLRKNCRTLKDRNQQGLINPMNS